MRVCINGVTSITLDDCVISCETFADILVSVCERPRGADATFACFRRVSWESRHAKVRVFQIVLQVSYLRHRPCTASAPGAPSGGGTRTASRAGSRGSGRTYRAVDNCGIIPTRCRGRLGVRTALTARDCGSDCPSCGHSTVY